MNAINNSKKNGGKAKHNPTTIKNTIIALMINQTSFIANR